MPEKKTLEAAQEDKREGKAPTTQAGEFVREEMHHVREGKHGARNPKQAIAEPQGGKLPRSDVADNLRSGQVPVPGEFGGCQIRGRMPVQVHNAALCSTRSFGHVHPVCFSNARSVRPTALEAQYCWRSFQSDPFIHPSSHLN